MLGIVANYFPSLRFLFFMQHLRFAFSLITNCPIPAIISNIAIVSVKVNDTP